jgi:uroporphyrin-III C-methyltransferase/precorrin-2 dehydrogenase/sirohydrochlorin ferrochelatase
VNYFPVFFDLEGQRVLIVGGGEVALRKVSLLERTGALITVVAPDIAPGIMQRAAQAKLKLAIREFIPDDLNGVRLVIVATSRRAVNRWIANLSEARNIPVNVVDDVQASRFIVPAIVDRDPVLVAISTGGASPVLARRLRERLEALIPARIGELASWLKALRGAARRRLRDTGARRRFFEAVVDGPAARRFIEGDNQGARRIAQQLLATTSAAPRAPGEVWLVGAGPGDPELLTLKALRALQDADVILHDRLVSPAVLDAARRDAALICVGKSAGGAGSTQEEINALMIEYANQGKRVVRLKGGDPFVFGRGGEEIEALRQAGVAYSVVPGITAGLGAAAQFEVPLTFRHEALRITFLTAHKAKDAEAVDWSTLTDEKMTIVVYMGMTAAPSVRAGLLAAGRSPRTPVGVFARVTRLDAEAAVGTLDGLPDLVENIDGGPAVLIIGDVVAHSAPWRQSELAQFASYFQVAAE